MSSSSLHKGSGMWFESVYCVCDTHSSHPLIIPAASYDNTTLFDIHSPDIIASSAAFSL